MFLHGSCLISIIVIYINVNTLHIQNIINKLFEVTDVDKMQLLVSYIQLFVDIVSLLWSSKTIQYYSLKALQWIGNMAESLFINKVSTVRKYLSCFSFYRLKNCINYWTLTSIDHLDDIRKSKKGGAKQFPQTPYLLEHFAPPLRMWE